MGVLDRAREISGLDESSDDQPQYVCLACQSAFEIQHHTCPACGSFDIRRAKWVPN